MSEVDQTGQADTRCPVCLGSGRYVTDMEISCPACNGAGVITAASPSSKPSDASENASGPQNSIDTLEAILTKVRKYEITEAEQISAIQNWHTQTAYQEVLELIGSDESADIHTEEINGIEGQMDYSAERNELRASLRAAAKAKYGV